MIGACSGGITSVCLPCRLGAAKCAEDEGPGARGLRCSTQSRSTDSSLGSLVTPQTTIAAKEASRLRGVLDGHDLARVFAWMRPNDLIWNYSGQQLSPRQRAAGLRHPLLEQRTQPRCLRACIRITWI